MRSHLNRSHFGTKLSIASVLLMMSVVLDGALSNADVIVLANRTGDPLTVQLMPLVGQPQRINLGIGEVSPIFLDCPAKVALASSDSPQRYLLNVNCAYYFGRIADGSVGLQQIGLGEDASTLGGRSLPGSVSRTPSATIQVKILVEEDEPTRQAFWEPLLRRRIEAASAILEKHCRIGLQIVAVGNWNSNDDTSDFLASLAEFEREVQPSPAQLAIGFTRQWSIVRGRTHMAGTRGPLHTHILVREGSRQISEPERLEFLVHELGHYLGASHSPEPESVMRAVLGDDLALRTDFHIQFDPVNTLIIGMIGEEIRRRRITQISDLTANTKQRLRQIYVELNRSLPNDPAGSHYAQLMGAASESTVAAPSRRVLQAIMQAAVANRALPVATDGGDTQSRRVGDSLTEYYVREAANAAKLLPDDVAPSAFLVSACGRFR